MGISVSAEIFDQTVSDHSVLVALLEPVSTTMLSAWQPDFGQDSRGASEKLLQTLLSALWLALDAAAPCSWAAETVSQALCPSCVPPWSACAANPADGLTLAGWLGSPDARQTRSVLALGRQVGPLRCGWFVVRRWSGLLCSFSPRVPQPVGLYVTIEETSGVYIRRMRLVDQAEPVGPAEAFGRLFGCRPKLDRPAALRPGAPLPPGD